MARKRIVRRAFRLTNNRIRLGVGLVLLGLFCIQCTQNELTAEPEWSNPTARTSAPDAVARLEQLARTDHVKLLRQALKHYDQTYHNYTCTFVKQERISGRLRPAQWIEAKFRQKPFSVAMKWTKNIPLGDRALYLEGKYNGMMLIRPSGMAGWLLGTQMRDPTSKQVMENTLRPITMFGFRNSLESLLEVYELAAGRQECENTYEGRQKVFEEEALVLVRTLPPRDDYPAKKTVVYLSTKHLVPLAVEGYDWDDQLICRYLFKDVNFQVNLTDEDFTPEANDMKAP